MRASRGIYLLALITGAAFAVWLFSWNTILPADPLHAPMTGDPTVSAIGQRYFLAEPWGWPLLRVTGLNAPQGVNIAMTDSIPLVMLALKLFRSLLPPGFFIGTGWVAIMWALQPVAAVFALRSTGERRLVPTIAVIVLSLSMPTLLIRYGHMALCSHAAILTALGLYFRLVAAPARVGYWLLAGAFTAACLLVHPYILALVAGVLAAVPATLLIRRDRRWRVAAGAYAAILLLVGIEAVVLDYGGTAPAPGFGYFSMNLLGPFLPRWSTLFPDLAIDATGGQTLEGYQYLGAGLLLLLAVAAIQVVRGRSGVAWRQHAGLLLVLAGMAVFALSNDVYAGRHRLLHIGHIPAIVQQFRATGRFFWPVAYAAMVTGVLVVTRSLPKRVSVALLALAAALQFVDAAPLRAGIWRTGHIGAGWAIDIPTLGPIFAAHDHLTLWPTFGCGGTVADDPTMQAMLLASQTVMSTNTMFSARTMQTASCDPATVLGQPLQPGELRVVTRASDHWLVPDADRVCRLSRSLVLCALDAPGWPLPPVVEPVLPVGTELGPVDPRLVNALAEGWWPAVPDGIWSDDDVPTLRFNLPPGTAAGLVMTVQAVGLATAPGGTQGIDVLANGKLIAHWTLPDLKAMTVQATLPASMSGPVILQMRVANPTRPVDRGMNEDVRRLGILLRGVRLDLPAS